MVFKYMSSSVPVSVEFGTVVVGPLGNVFVLFCMSMLASFFYKVLSHFALISFYYIMYTISIRISCLCAYESTCSLCIGFVYLFSTRHISRKSFPSS
jgi:hypothetical protein